MISFDGSTIKTSAATYYFRIWLHRHDSNTLTLSHELLRVNNQGREAFEYRTEPEDIPLAFVASYCAKANIFASYRQDRGGFTKYAQWFSTER